MADLTDLQRRAAAALARLYAAGRVASPWLPGMLVADDTGARVFGIDPAYGAYAADGGERGAGVVPLLTEPDLSDPLTVQGLVLLAREAWGQGDLVATYWTVEGPRRWCVEFTGADDDFGPGQCHAWYGATEAEAAVAALEAAVEVPDAE